MPFIEGDIKNMPYEDNSLSGYLSFGVMEHFIEGPKEAMDEMYRVMRPGGVAIITTPNNSWNIRRGNIKKWIKKTIKKILCNHTKYDNMIFIIKYKIHLL